MPELHRQSFAQARHAAAKLVGQGSLRFSRLPIEPGERQDETPEKREIEHFSRLVAPPISQGRFFTVFVCVG